MPEVTDPRLLARLKTQQPQMVNPNPMFPGQLEGQGLSNTGTRLQNAERAGTLPYAVPKAQADLQGQGLSNQRTAQDIHLDRSKAAIALAQQYAADPRVKSYREIVPAVASALTAAPDPRGDLTVIYSWAKAMDPMGSVREGDTDLARSTASYKQRFDQLLAQANQGNGLPKEVRSGLINEMRNRGHQLNLAYSEARKQYSGLSTEAGFDPNLVVGPHDGGKYQKDEANFKGAPVINLDGSQGAAPDPNRWRTVSDQEIRDFVLQNQGMDPKAMQEYAHFKLGRNIDNLPEVMDYLAKTGKINPNVVRTETGSSMLNGLAKGALDVWDRAAIGTENAINGMTGSNLTGAHEAVATREPAFAGKAIDPDYQASGQMLGATAMTWPIKGPMLAGAAGGMLMGDSKDGTGLLRDAVLGGAGGFVGGKIARGVAQAIDPQIGEATRRLATEGGRLTPGRFFPGLKKAEDLARSYPIVGDKIDAAMERTAETVNRIPPNRVLGHIGQQLPADVPAGHPAVAHTQKTLSDGYDQNLSGINVNLDPTFLTRMNYLGQRGGLRPQEVETLSDILQREVGGTFANGRGSMSGRDFKRLDSRLGSMATKLTASADDPFKVQLGENVGFVKDQLGALLRRQLPDRADNLRSLNRAYADFVPYQRAAAMELSDGIASPGQFASAVRQSDRSIRKGATAKGEAKMQDFAMDTAQVLPATRGNSGSSDRTNFASPKAWALGTLLSPLYTEPAIDAINLLAKRKAGPLSKAFAKQLRALPGVPLSALVAGAIDPAK